MTVTQSILVVEDNRDTLELIGRMLDTDSYTVILTNHAYDALEVLETTAIHLMLIDINLPRVNGIELLQQIREKQAFAHIPAIAITANVVSASRAICLEAGFNEHITKPVTRTELMDAVEAMLKRES